MADDRGVAPPRSERLARLYFELVQARDAPQILDLMHPEVELTLKTRGGQVLRGKDEVAEFLQEVSDARSMYETSAERFHSVDEARVIVEGRIRWIDDQRVLRDDPMVWALEFSGGLLRRSMPARSVGEAQAILAASPGLPREPEEPDAG